MPVVVTVSGFPTGARASFDLNAGEGVQTACAGPIWDSGQADRRSQTCYVWLPKQSRSVTPSATVSIEGDNTVSQVSGSASRPILSRGEPSQKLSLEQIRNIERCGNTTDEIWLTFDDAASPAQVDQLISVLEQENVKATFFMLGDWDRANPGLAGKLVAAGHDLGNHSATHEAFSDLSRDGVRQEIQQGLQPRDEPKLVRPPYAAGAFSSRVGQVAQDLGYQVCRWTADTADWQPTSTEAMVERVIDGDGLAPPLRAGGNVLMHAGNDGTIAALPTLIDAIRGAGFTLRPLR